MKMMGSGGFAGAGLGESFSTYICPIMANDVEFVVGSCFQLLGTPVRKRR